jgi:hypothetical protein
MPTAQEIVLGYTWPLSSDDNAGTSLRRPPKPGPLLVNTRPGALVVAVNSGELRYDVAAGLYMLDRSGPVGYEHWEYSGLQLDHRTLDRFVGKNLGGFVKVRSGEKLGLVPASGQWGFGLHKSTFQKPFGVKGYQDPFEYLSFYKAHYPGDIVSYLPLALGVGALLLAAKVLL